MERKTGFEPATFGMASRRSTTELLPPALSTSRSVILTCFACPVNALLLTSQTAVARCSSAPAFKNVAHPGCSCQ